MSFSIDLEIRTENLIYSALAANESVGNTRGIKWRVMFSNIRPCLPFTP